jgi:predicted metal-dependent hydrolase
MSDDKKYIQRKSIEGLNPEEILEAVKNQGDVYIYPRLDTPTRAESMRLFDSVMDQETKLSQALSRGISEQRGYTAKTRIPDMVADLSEVLGLEKTPDIEFSYMDDIAGAADPKNNKIILNPQHLSTYGRESIIAHELRHLKEETGPNKRRFNFVDESIGAQKYRSSGGNALQSLYNYGERKDTKKKMIGKGLSHFNPKEERLFENDKLKSRVSALDTHEFLDRKHFQKVFLGTNL